MKVRLKDIAQKANVSVATVSNVIRGKHKVSPETRERVMQIAQELGYFGQSKRKTGLIGVLACRSQDASSQFQSSCSSKLAGFFGLEALEGIEKAASSQNFQLLFENLPQDINTTLPRMLIGQKVDGLILIGGTIPDRFILSLREQNTPFVLLYTQVEGENINCVLADNLGAAYRATRYFIRLGHSNIALINGWKATHTSFEKLAGYKKALAEGGVPFRNEYALFSDFSFKGGYNAMIDLLDLADKPSAVFVADDTMAAGALAALKKRKVRVPEEVAIMGFGNTPISISTNPTLTTVDVPKRQIGEIGTRLLLDVLENPEALTKKIIVAVELVFRESTTNDAGSNV